MLLEDLGATDEGGAGEDDLGGSGDTEDSGGAGLLELEGIIGDGEGEGEAFGACGFFGGGKLNNPGRAVLILAGVFGYAFFGVEPKKCNYVACV